MGDTRGHPRRTGRRWLRGWELAVVVNRRKTTGEMSEQWGGGMACFPPRGGGIGVEFKEVSSGTRRGEKVEKTRRN